MDAVEIPLVVLKARNLAVGLEQIALMVLRANVLDGHRELLVLERQERLAPVLGVAGQVDEAG